MLKEYLFAIPIGIIYSILANNISNYLFEDYENKFQMVMIGIFLFSLLGISLALTIFTRDRRFKNNSIRNGLLFGSIILLLSSMYVNWDNLDSSTRTIIFGMLFFILLYFSY
jgi:uncharacterized membrane protein